METKEIPGFPGFNVTDDGQVINSRGIRLSDYNCNGYRRINLKRSDGKRVGVDVHRLVALAWIGPIPRGYWVNHENGNKADNRVENLRIDTPSYNHRHAHRTLGRQPGNTNNDRADAVALLLGNGWSQYRIARALGCSQPNVSKMVRGRVG